MRSIIIASAVIFMASTAPSLARDYPWCARTRLTAGNPQCSYTSFGQCQAYISGIGGDCIYNPILAYGRPDRGRRAFRRDRGW
jgi:Protein of unknown function (DUF3551)